MSDNQVELIKSVFSPEDKKAHEVLKKMLWVMYPRPETTGDDDTYEDDIASDGCAAMIIDSLKKKGIGFHELDQDYVSPVPPITEDEIDLLLQKYPDKSSYS